MISDTNGALNITTSSGFVEFEALNDTSMEYVKTNKTFISGMVQGWNKFCFTGGILEVRAKLPGEAYIGGLWPAIWMLGNMARATYVGSANWIWPWSLEKCNRNLQQSQLISGCNANNHFGMAHY